MIKSNQILDMAKKNNGHITTREVRNAGINTSELTKLVSQNKLERIVRGYYSLPDYFSDDFYKYQLKSKQCVFSHSTALYFFDLSDRTPLCLDLTVPIGYNGSLRTSENVILHYVKKEILELGMTYVETPFGMNVRVYDIERTICDIIKNKSKMDIEIFVKALQKYSQLKKKDLNKLMKYSKQLKIEKKVREYMEILL